MTTDPTDLYLQAAILYCERMGIDPHIEFINNDWPMRGGKTETRAEILKFDIRGLHAQIAALIEVGLLPSIDQQKSLEISKLLAESNEKMKDRPRHV